MKCYEQELEGRYRRKLSRETFEVKCSEGEDGVGC